MKGIVLAGGTGSRLLPITKSVNKHLLPIFDKPMIYFPISTLMLSGIREILIISSPNSIESFQNLLSDGQQFGISISYATQEKPNGIAESLLIAESFIDNSASMLILGDNIFYGSGLGENLVTLLPNKGAHIFTTKLNDPSNYGVLFLDKFEKPLKIVEKPIVSESKHVITGLYYFASNPKQYVQNIEMSERGEYEITTVLQNYLEDDLLTFTQLPRGTTWLDTGNFDNLLEAGNLIKGLQNRSGIQISLPDEIALRKNWITKEKFDENLKKFYSDSFKNYLKF